MVKVKVTREPIRSDDTFDTLEGDDDDSTIPDNNDDCPTPAKRQLLVEDENQALRSQLKAMQLELAYWKSKASNAEGKENGSDTSTSTKSRLQEQTGLWQRGMNGLRYMVSTPEKTTLKAKNSFANVGMDTDEEGLQFPNKAETRLHHRRTAAATATSYFQKCNISPFKFYDSEDTHPIDTLSVDTEEEVSLVMKSRSSDRDEDSSSGSHEESEPTFYQSLVDRGSWLVGLLVLQSFSSFILKNNEALLQRHAVIVRFLTMLVGAGGNAGNQASVRVIRGLATGKVDADNVKPYLRNELMTGFYLSVALGVAGCIRAAVFFTPLAETIAITASLVLIVAISILLGTILPLLMRLAKIDPAHSSTTIQVLMDILGVGITVYVSSFVLDSQLFARLSSKG